MTTFRSKSKYHARKITRDGVTYDSLKEYRRFCDLSLLQRAGAITDLQRQVPFELIPAQYEEIPTGEVYQRGERRGQPKMKRVCVEQSVSYVADFVYYKDGERIVEDVKGYKKGTAYAVFTIKRKLMRLKGIKIREV